MNGSSSSTLSPPIVKRVVAVAHVDVGRIEPPERDVVAGRGTARAPPRARDDGGAARGERRDRLRVRLGDALDGAEELEVLGPDVRDDDDVRARDRAEGGDLAETAHPHLDDQDHASRARAGTR